MDARLRPGPALIIAPLITALAVGVWAHAQDAGKPEPEAPPVQAPDSNASPTANPPSPGPPPATTAPAANETPTPSAADADASNSETDPDSDNTTANATPQAKPPVEAPRVVRSQVAILQALDKVTAETMRFAAPVGRAVRYKSLVITVKACETRDVDSALPKASAYVVITSAPRLAAGSGPPPVKQVFRGWMFAQAPGLDALQHPIYDAWLIACSASAPVS